MHLVTNCRVCGGTIDYQESPTGGWWIHWDHPDDDHDAVGPAVRSEPDEG